MATDKPKIQGYVEQQVWQAFHGFQVKHGMSQSQTLEALLVKALGIEGGEQDGKIEPISQSRLDQLENSLELLRNDMYELMNCCIFRLEVLEAQSSNLFIDTPDGLLNEPVVEQSEPEVIYSNLESDIPDGLPDEPVVEQSEPEVIYSNLESDIPDGLPDEPVVIPDNLPSDTPETQLVEQDEPGDDLYVICRYNTLPPNDPEDFRYWGGTDRGFDFSMKNARTYKSEKMAQKQVLRIIKNDTYYVPDKGWEIRFNRVSFFKEIEFKRQAAREERRATREH